MDSLNASDWDSCPEGRDCNDPVQGMITIAQFYPHPEQTVSNQLILTYTIPQDAAPGNSYTLKGEVVLFDAQGEIIPSVSVNNGAITVTGDPGCPETGVTLSMPGMFFQPGDPCGLTADICNSGTEDLTGIPFFCLLAVGDVYFYYPSWNDTGDWQMLNMIQPGEMTLDIIESFTWPQVDSAGIEMVFYAAMITPEFTGLLGEMDQWVFEF